MTWSKQTVNVPYLSILTTQFNHLACVAKWLSVRLQNKWRGFKSQCIHLISIVNISVHNCFWNKDCQISGKFLKLLSFTGVYRTSILNNNNNSPYVNIWKHQPFGSAYLPAFDENKSNRKNFSIGPCILSKMEKNRTKNSILLYNLFDDDFFWKTFSHLIYRLRQSGGLFFG